MERIKKNHWVLVLMILALLTVIIILGCNNDEDTSAIIYAKRAWQWQGHVPSNPEEDVLLVLKVDGSYNADLDNSYLVFNDQQLSFEIGQIGLISGVEASKLVVAVPQDVLLFELHIDNKPPIEFEAEAEIHDNL